MSKTAPYKIPNRFYRFYYVNVGVVIDKTSDSDSVIQLFSYTLGGFEM